MCQTGTIQGPNGANCGAKSWYFGTVVGAAHTCPDCSVFTSCTACTDLNACAWTASGTCAPLGTNSSSSYCQCNQYSQCTDCLRGGCAFCTNSGLCLPRDPPPPADCKVKIGGCDCASITDCAVCAEQEDICQWCAGNGQCMKDQDAAQCATGLTEQCGSPSTWNGGTFFGGIVLGVVLTLLVLAGFYAYKTYYSNQYTSVNG